jgi:hypothetical protein
MRVTKWVPLVNIAQLGWLTSGVEVKRFDQHPSEEDEGYILIHEGKGGSESGWRMVDLEDGCSIKLTQDNLQELKLVFPLDEVWAGEDLQ